MRTIRYSMNGYMHPLMQRPRQIPFLKEKKYDTAWNWCSDKHRNYTQHFMHHRWNPRQSSNLRTWYKSIFKLLQLLYTLPLLQNTWIQHQRSTLTVTILYWYFSEQNTPPPSFTSINIFWLWPRTVRPVLRMLPSFPIWSDLIYLVHIGLSK